MNQNYLRRCISLLVLLVGMFALPAISRAADANSDRTGDELYIHITDADGKELVGVTRMTKHADGNFSFPFIYKYEYTDGVKFRFYDTNLNIESGNATTYSAPQEGAEAAQNQWCALTAHAGKNEVGLDYTVKDPNVPWNGKVNKVFIVSKERDQVMVKRATRYVTGMPFFPNKATSEPEFAQLGDDEEFYYLVGAPLNNGRPSPEWELEDKGDGVYTLDFTYFGYGNDNLSVVAFTKNDTEPETKIQTPITIKPKAGYETAGVRVRATYIGGSLSFNYLNADGEIVQDVNDAQHLPAVSFFSYSWLQHTLVPDAIEVPVGDQYGPYGNFDRPSQLPQAWVQYESGKVVESRDGNVLYSTQWPPKNEVMLIKNFRDSIINSNKEKEYGYYMLGLNSDNLTFRQKDKSINSAEDWLKDSRFTGKVSFSNAPAGAKYMLYEVSDVWLDGTVKLWTGWNGNVSQGWAELNKMFNWEKTIDEPTYFKNAYLFINQDNLDDIAVYLEDADASIMATNNWNNTKGNFFPRILNYPEKGEGDGREFSNIIVNLYSMADPNTDHYLRPKMVSENKYKWQAKSNLWHTDSWRNFDYPRLERDNAKDFNEIFGYPLHPSISDSDKDYYTYGQFAPDRTDVETELSWYIDSWNYYMSGWYFYTLEVSFDEGEEDESRIVAKSSPFYVQLPETPLHAFQLIDATNSKNEKYNWNGKAYDYITQDTIKHTIWESEWSSKVENKVYGVTVDGNGNPVSVDKIPIPGPDFYEEYNWTDLLLLVNEVPLELLPEMTDEASWGYMGEFMSKDEYPGNQPFYRILRANTLNDNNFNVDYYYKSPKDMYVDIDAIAIPEEETVARSNFRETYHTTQSLRIPTPRLNEGLTLEVEDLDYADDHLVADSYRGATRALKEYDDEDAHKYENARLRSLKVTLPLERPNATDDLLSYISDETYGVTITDSYERITSDGGDYSYDNTEDNDKTFTGSGLSFSDNYDVNFVDQNITKWIKNTDIETISSDSYEPKEHTMKMTLSKPDGVKFYDRSQKDIIAKVANPSFTAPNLNGTDDNTSWNTEQLKAMIRYHLELNELNKWVLHESIYLTAFPALELSDNQGTGNIGNCVFDINIPSDDNPAVPHYAFGIKRVNQGTADDEGAALVGLDGIEGLADEKSTPSLISQTFFTNTDSSYENSILVSRRPIDQEEGEKDSKGHVFYTNLPNLQLGIGQAYFFNVNDRIEFVPRTASNGAEAASEARAKAPRRAAEQEDPITVAFVPVLDTYELQAEVVKDVVSEEGGGVTTGLNEITGNFFAIYTGEGFIDLNGNEATVYYIDGRQVYSGSGRAYVPQGVYVVRLDGASVKVFVK